MAVAMSAATPAAAAVARLAWAVVTPAAAVVTAATAVAAAVLVGVVMEKASPFVTEQTDKQTSVARCSYEIQFQTVVLDGKN